MTPPLLSSLDDNAKRVLIAERCGWNKIVNLPPGSTNAQIIGWVKPNGLRCYEAPDYCHSLDAMAQAEQTEWIGDLRKLRNDAATYYAWNNYNALLERNISASASQRADAFLLATGLAQ